MPTIVRLDRHRKDFALDVTAFYRQELTKLKGVHYSPEQIRTSLAIRVLPYFQELARQGNRKVTPQNSVTRVHLVLEGEQLIGVRETTDYVMDQDGEAMGLSRHLVWLLAEPKGRGTGTLLLDDMIQNADGVDALVLSVAGKNRRAKKLYSSKGFEYCLTFKGDSNYLSPMLTFVLPITDLGRRTLLRERKSAKLSV